MDWYYPVLSSALSGEAAAARIEQRWDTFAMEGRGIRCVSDRPWVTAAETCECAIACAAMGDLDRAQALFEWAQQYRVEGGRYWTGTVFPDGTHFPADEQSTYTAAAVVLAADALARPTRASLLFVAPDAVLPRVVVEARSDARAERD
jgi:hypothetical protein